MKQASAYLSGYISQLIAQIEAKKRHKVVSMAEFKAKKQLKRFVAKK
jgi:hypothetical protein